MLTLQIENYNKIGEEDCKWTFMRWEQHKPFILDFSKKKIWCSQVYSFLIFPSTLYILLWLITLCAFVVDSLTSEQLNLVNEQSLTLHGHHCAFNVCSLQCSRVQCITWPMAITFIFCQKSWHSRVRRSWLCTEEGGKSNPRRSWSRNRPDLPPDSISVRWEGASGARDPSKAWHFTVGTREFILVPMRNCFGSHSVGKF